MENTPRDFIKKYLKNFIISKDVENKKLVEREKLGKIISEKIINSLDYDKVLTNICDELQNQFDAERVLLVNATDQNDYSKCSIVRCNSAQQSIQFENLTYEHKKEIGGFWGKTLYEGNGYYYSNDICNSDLPEVLKHFYLSAGATSIAGIMLKDVESNWGCLFLLRKGNKKWTQDDMELLQSISNHIFIALIHSQVHTDLKNQLEKEQLLKKDESILINRNLARNLGLGCSIVYSSISNNFQYSKDENRLNTEGYAHINFADLEEMTFLEKIEIKNSLYKLLEKGMVEFKMLSDIDIVYRIIQDENLLQQLLTDPTDKKIKEKFISYEICQNHEYNVTDLNQFYMQFFPASAVNAVNYFFEKSDTSFNKRNYKIAKSYYAVICRTLDDFMENHKLDLSSIAIVLDNLFSKQKDTVPEVEQLGQSTKALVSRLKKILFYRLHESRLLASDFLTKLELYSNPELLFSDNVKFLEEILPKEKN